MNIRKLVIISTLTALSVVALAGLVLLPITNGICDGESEFYESDWTYSDKNRAASYSAKHYGALWSLSASVDARVVNASVSVSPFELTDWAEDGTLLGTATVTASRGDYCVKDRYFHNDNNYYSCDRWFFGCWGHSILRQVEGSGDTDTNKRSGDAPQSDSLILEIQITSHTETRADAWSNKEGKEVTISIGLDLELPASGSFDIGTKGTYKNETLRSTSESWQVTGVKKAFMARNVGRYAGVSYFPNTQDHIANFGSLYASVDFSFYDADSDASVLDDPDWD